MGRWLDRYNKRPQKAQDILYSATSFRAGLGLNRNFGESTESYFKRKPDSARYDKEAADDIREIKRRAGIR